MRADRPHRVSIILGLLGLLTTIAILAWSPSPAHSSETPPAAPPADPASELTFVETNAEGYRVFRHPRDGALLIEVPDGTFPMGETPETTAALNKKWKFWLNDMIHAMPLHEVRIGTFLIDRTPITVRQYRKFLDAVAGTDRTPWCHPDEPFGKSHVPNMWDQQLHAGEEYPVFAIDWFDAHAYAAWAGRSLPTEAQWEKAAAWDAKTGRKRLYPWGDDWDIRRARSAEEIAGGEKGETEWWKNWLQECRTTLSGGMFPPIVAVGTYPSGASPYGVLDMAGNISQWAMDWCDPSYYASSPHDDPAGPESGDFKAIRGSSWFVGGYFVTTTRTRHEPWNRCGGVGIRTVSVPHAAR